MAVISGHGDWLSLFVQGLAIIFTVLAAELRVDDFLRALLSTTLLITLV